MFHELIFDPLVGERTGCVEAERLEVAGEHLYGGDAAGFNRLDELGPGGERKIRPALAHRITQNGRARRSKRLPTMGGGRHWVGL